MPRLHLVASLLSFALLVTPSVANVWDFEYDWDHRPVDSQPPPDWAYLAFKQNTHTYDTLTYRNSSYFDYPVTPPAGYTHSFPYVSRWHTAHPGTHGSSVKAAVVRFIAPWEGEFVVNAWFTRNENNTTGNGVDVGIFPSGIQGMSFPEDVPDFSVSNVVFYRYLSQNSYGSVKSYGPHSFWLSSGQPIDFVVFNHANDYGDSTRMNAHIEFVPEPTTLSLWALGGVALMQRRWIRKAI